MIKEFFLSLEVDFDGFEVSNNRLSLHCNEFFPNRVDDCISHLNNEIPMGLVKNDHIPHPPNDLEFETLREEGDYPFEQVQLWNHLFLFEVEK